MVILFLTLQISIIINENICAQIIPEDIKLNRDNNHNDTTGRDYNPYSRKYFDYDNTTRYLKMKESTFPSNNFSSQNISDHQNDYNYFTNESINPIWVKHFSSGRMVGDDEACEIALDRSGNVYVTGRSINSYDAYDYLTVKYNSNGQQIWAARYNGTGNRNDEPIDIIVDSMGNVYVTGTSWGSGTGDDYVTIKYDTDGNQLWVARYDGFWNNGTSRAYALAIDDSNCVYVAGASWGYSSFDYVIVKYNPDGNQIWVARSWADGQPFDIVVDKSSNVYVTGRSYGQFTWADFLTVKYDANGNELWAKRYNGTTNSYDAATAIAIDELGNVYVTGTSGDYITIKYDSVGNQLWIARYNGLQNSLDEAFALSVDLDGNVHVTGRCYYGIGTSNDMVTVKYDSNGNQIWIVSYNGPENYSDEATAIALDRTGNVYVTGSSYSRLTSYDYTTIKYNSFGEQEWVMTYNGSTNNIDKSSSIAVDVDGNVYVVGMSTQVGAGKDYTTIKYESSGNNLWVANYDGPGNSYDEAVSCKIDPIGNVYVLGISRSSLTGSDFVTIKYDVNGTQIWAAYYNGSANGHDNASSLAVDNYGNVYILGTSVDTITGSDILVIKYNTDGMQEWKAKYSGPGTNSDIASALTTDNSGNVYIAGITEGLIEGHDYITIKYDASGVKQWVKKYNGPGNSFDFASDICADNSGNVYVTGWSLGTGTFYDYATIKYDERGNEVLVARYNGSTNGSDQPYAIAIDESSNVYVTGFGDYDYTTIKYNKYGNQLWVAKYNGIGNNLDWPKDITVDGKGNVYVTGQSWGGDWLYNDIATIKYNSSGNQIWVARYNGPRRYSEEGKAITMDNAGNIYVTGTVYSSDSRGQDYVTLKYNENGTLQWISYYDGPGGSHDTPSTIALDNNGNLFITGTSEYILMGRVITTIKYSQNPTSVKEFSQIPIDYRLAQNYPNPFNPTTLIKYDLPTNSYVTLKIYDVLGREVVKLVDGFQEAGYKSIEFNAVNLTTGVYFYKLVASPLGLSGSNYTSVKKMLFIR